MKEKKESLATGYLLMTIMPLIAVIIILFVFAANRYSTAVSSMKMDELITLGDVTIMQFNSIFPGDYALRSVKTENGDGLELIKGDLVISDKPNYFDEFKEKTQTDISLIYSDTRIITTFADSSGRRAVGTGINQQVMNAVYAEGINQRYDNVKIENSIYIAVYLPISNTDGKVVGMLELAKKKDVISDEIRKNILPLVIIAVLSILFFAYISLKFASRILKRIGLLKLFLTKVSEGNLNESLGIEVLQVKDELGEAGLAATDMQKSIRNLVEKDALTEIYNRRYATGYLTKVIKKAQISGQPFAVCIADIDFFKKVNDTYGHDMGDVVLKEVASLLKNQMIGQGMAARFGGEEFLLVFDKVGMNEGAEVLQEALEKLRRMTFEYENLTFSVTMTFGIVDGNPDLGQDALLKQADEKLYDGKQNGRNRVVV